MDKFILDYIKTSRKFSREEEIRLYGKPLPYKLKNKYKIQLIIINNSIFVKERRCDCLYLFMYIVIYNYFFFVFNINKF